MVLAVGVLNQRQRVPMRRDGVVTGAVAVVANRSDDLALGQLWFSGAGGSVCRNGRKWILRLDEADRAEDF